MEPQDIQQVIKSHRKQLLITVAVILGICILAVLILSKRHDNILAEQVKIQQDSLKAHDKRYQIQITSLQHTYDSSITTIQEQQNNLQQQLGSIHNRYDKERKQLNNSSLDNRFKFFSDHLSPRK